MNPAVPVTKAIPDFIGASNLLFIFVPSEAELPVVSQTEPLECELDIEFAF